MARLLVFSDNLAARVEVFDDPLTGYLAALCLGCNRGRSTDGATDLLEDERARFQLEDAVQEVVSPHADRCTYCADADCLIGVRHERGHRCRRNERPL